MVIFGEDQNISKINNVPMACQISFLYNPKCFIFLFANIHGIFQFQFPFLHCSDIEPQLNFVY